MDLKFSKGYGGRGGGGGENPHGAGMKGWENLVGIRGGAERKESNYFLGEKMRNFCAIRGEWGKELWWNLAVGLVVSGKRKRKQ